MWTKTLRHRIWVGTIALALTRIAAGQASALRPETLPRMKPGPPVTYGTSQISFVTMFEGEFSPADSLTTYGDVGVGSLNLLRYKTGGDSGFFGNPHLPGGAVLTNVEFDLCDSSTSDAHLVAAAASCGA